jgi:hypothetical protein
LRASSPHLAIAIGCAIALPRLGFADDLGETIAWIESATPGLVGQLETDSPPDDDMALAMLNSRDIERGRPLEEYDCVEGSTVDAEWVLRNTGNNRYVDRWCRELMWKRNRLRGYKTLGKVRLDQRKLMPIFEAASRETEIPVSILDAIVRLESGYRPGVISDTGHKGLMQLPRHVVRAMRIKNPLDPRQNIFGGARYLRKMLDRFDGVLEPALAALKLGPLAVEREGRIVPNDRRTLWFVREVRRLYKADVDPVPMKQGLEDVVYVMSWLERGREVEDD